MNKLLIIIGLVFMSNFVNGQLPKIIKPAKVDRVALLEFSERQSRLFYENYKLALGLAKEKGWPIEGLSGIDKNGNPIYIGNDNVTSSELIHTNDVNSGGALGDSLDGAGFNIGLWEFGGIPRITHETYKDVNNNTRVSILNPNVLLTNHAGHVAGTLIGNGIDSVGTKGMAPKAKIRAYDSVNDLAEMGFAATSQNNPVYVSNHSYGRKIGWSIDPPCNNCPTRWTWFGGGAGYFSSSEPVDFGRYGGRSVSVDSLCYLASNLSVFKAAGNDGNNNPTPNVDQVRNFGSTFYQNYNLNIHPFGDGFNNNRYDLLGPFGVAKNVITVGAVAQDSSMSSFSSWGPTDDGRIKPDIVADGVDLISSIANSDTSYWQLSGTSMATPSVAGSAVLLHEKYKNLFGNQVMNSATMKALLIHTASDLGNPGPDYKHGWGLMNTLKAVNTLNDIKDTLNGTTLYNETYDGTEIKKGLLCDCSYSPDAIELTLVYLDRAGFTQINLDNSTSNLVNDLDMSLSTAVLGDPFVLDPNVPSANATRGDNDRDNLERIKSILPQPIEILTLTHEGGLTGTQKYSLIVAGDALDNTCIITEDQPNVDIESEEYCNKTDVTSRAIINNKITRHTSLTKITLKPGFSSGSGSSSKFEILPPCVYF